MAIEINKDKILKIFCKVDDFCKELDAQMQPHLIGKRPRTSRLSHSEVTTIIILFHLSGYRNIKTFYLFYVKLHLKGEFPATVSYNRFTERMQSSVLYLALFVKKCCMGACSGISFVDSTSISVCKNKRISRNRVFKDTAALGKSTIGFFFGFKLHFMVNDQGERLNFRITKGNVDDHTPLKRSAFGKGIWGKLFGGKGYLSKDLFQHLFQEGIQLITSVRKKMKNALLELKDKILLRKRSLIETINDQLKNICQIEHTRHPSFGNFIINLLGGLAAYSFCPKKPALKFSDVETKLLPTFFDRTQVKAIIDGSSLTCLWIHCLVLLCIIPFL